MGGGDLEKRYRKQKGQQNKKTQKYIMEQNDKRKVEKKIEKREFKQKLAGGHQRQEV